MSLLRWYLEAGALLAVVAVLTWAALKVAPARAKAWLRLAHVALVLALKLPLLATWLPREALPRPSVQVWSGHMRGAQPKGALLTRASAEPVPATSQGMLLLESWLKAGGALVLLAVAYALALHVIRLRRLTRALRVPVEIRRIGRVSIRVAPSGIPYSAWLPGQAVVVVPERMIGSSRLRIALAHELEHHRSRDTLWVHLYQIIGSLYVWHPLARAWVRAMEQLQELACDETLVGRRGISPQDYGRCLLEVAQQGLSAPSAVTLGTTAMARGRSSRFLKRRVEMLFSKKRRFSAVIQISGFVLVLSLMAGSALAARGLVQDRRLGIAEAQALAARSQGEIPVTINERVLARLNRYVGTPEGREFVRASLGRMPQYRAMIDRKITEYDAPLELLAVPLAEAGFKNTWSPSHNGAGLWMFIPSTARRYGLRVDAQVDERLDVEKETDAGMRYLRDLMAEFGDWRLALRGYNEGESRVRSLIAKHHTVDAWELERLEPSNDDYLATVMAMILILRNPQLVE